MHSQRTTSSVAIVALIDLLCDQGFTHEEIEQGTGIQRKKMDDPYVRISMDQFLTLWEVAIRWTKNPALPLTLREKGDSKLMHLVAHIGMTSSDLKEAIEKWSRYARLVCDADRIELREEKDCSLLVYENTSPDHRNIWIPEHHLALAFRYGEVFTGVIQPPLEVHFQHPPTQYLDDYQRVFRCPVLFNQDENALVLLKGTLSIPIRTTNRYLGTILSQHAESLLEHLGPTEKVTDRVMNLISRHISSGRVDVGFMAQQMNMHSKTLYRQLKQEGTSFQNILENTRKKLAVRYLKQGLSATEITFLLGFSEPSAFQRAFKRWFGKSPGSYRCLLF